MRLRFVPARQTRPEDRPPCRYWQKVSAACAAKVSNAGTRGTGRCGFDSPQRMPATPQTSRSSRSMAGDWIKMRGDLGTHRKLSASCPH